MFWTDKVNKNYTRHQRLCSLRPSHLEFSVRSHPYHICQWCDCCYICQTLKGLLVFVPRLAHRRTFLVRVIIRWLILSQGRGCDRHQLLNWLCRACDDPRSATAPLLSPRRAHGTVCLTHCTDCHHWNNSRNIWKLIYFKPHLRNRTACDCKALLKRLVLPTALL